MPHTDHIDRLLFEETSIRAVYVNLNQTLTDTFDKHQYPATIKKNLAEMLAANLLLSTGIKFTGKLILQIQDQGAIKMIVTKSNQDYDIVGYAEWDDVRLESDTEENLIGGKMVLTVINDQTVRPYQSIVEIKPEGVAASLEHYFTQSAQLDTKIIIHSDNDSTTGILLQLMPGGDSKALNIYYDAISQKLENQTKASTSGKELFEQTLPDIEIKSLASDLVQYKCGCDAKKMENAIQTLGEDDARQLLKTRKKIVVTCEFCHNQYAFNDAEVGQIFSGED